MSRTVSRTLSNPWELTWEPVKEPVYPNLACAQTKLKSEFSYRLHAG